MQTELTPYSEPWLQSIADRLAAHLGERRLPSNITPTVSDVLDLIEDPHGLAILFHALNRAENRGQ